MTSQHRHDTDFVATTNVDAAMHRAYAGSTLGRRANVVRVTFTDNLKRHVECPPMSVAGGNVRDVLAAVFTANPRAKGYVLDDQGGVRRHMIVFVNGRAIQDRTALSDPVPDGAEVYVMQALSGG